MTTARFPGTPQHRSDQPRSGSHGEYQPETRPPEARGYGTQQARPSSTPVGHGMGFERGLVSALGIVLVLAGAAALLVGLGLAGAARSQRPVLDPVVMSWFELFPLIVFTVAIVLGVLLLLLGLWWVVHTLRPEPRPDLQLASDLTLRGRALTRAVREDAEAVPDVTRAKARMSGDSRRPYLRLTLALREGADVRAVWDELDDRVLSRTRTAVDTETMPTAIRLQLDRSPGQRVS